MSRTILTALALLLFSAPTLSQTATYYSHHYTGKKMANGQRYHPDALIAAHPRHPIGTRLKVTNPKTGKSVIVTVSDRCSCSLDMSRAAFKQIAGLHAGRISVTVSRI